MVRIEHNHIPNSEDRLTAAFLEKGDFILRKLQEIALSKENLNILIIAYKALDVLEIYAKNTMVHTYEFLTSYSIAARSGQLGPKKYEGDKQVPEGIYWINRFNPKSKYHLSLGLNYPNSYDQNRGYTGSNIFIHGNIETQGCLPMTDDKMKEIYLLACWAHKSGQIQIPVYIFPFKMTPTEMLSQQHHFDKETLSFWQNLQEGYALFSKNRIELAIHVQNSRYQFDNKVAKKIK